MVGDLGGREGGLGGREGGVLAWSDAAWLSPPPQPDKIAKNAMPDSHWRLFFRGECRVVKGVFMGIVCIQFTCVAEAYRSMFSLAWAQADAPHQASMKSVEKV